MQYGSPMPCPLSNQAGYYSSAGQYATATELGKQAMTIRRGNCR